MNSTEFFIEKIKVNKCLYDLGHKDYKNVYKKQKIWEGIGKSVHATAEECKKRWKMLRDGYKRRKRAVEMPSGSGAAIAEVKWKFFDQMSFLDGCKDSRPVNMTNAKEKLFWTEFLELYESMPCLWKITSSEYSNRELKNISYKKLVKKLKEIDPDANREKVAKKINVFRTNYKRDLKKIKKSQKSGAGVDDVFESSLWYFDKLKFLEDQECSLEGKCSMDSESFDNVEDSRDEIQQPSKKRKITAEDNLLELTCDKLASSNDAACVLAKGWASQYEELSSTQKVFARIIFADVLFHGCLEKLSERTVDNVHKVLRCSSNASSTDTRFLSRASTPYMDEHTTYSLPSSHSSQQYSEKAVFSQQPESRTVYFQHNRPSIENQEIILPESKHPTMPSVGQYIEVESFLGE